MAEAEPGAEVETVEDLRPGQPDLGESEHDTAGALRTVELWHTNVIEAESGNAELPVGSHEAGTGSGTYHSRWRGVSHTGYLTEDPCRMTS